MGGVVVVEVVVVAAGVVVWTVSDFKGLSF